MSHPQPKLEGVSGEPRGAVAWALYDVANSAFATTVMAGFFPLFFKQYWSSGVDAATSTTRLGILSAMASAVVAVLAPWLGALADAGIGKKKLLSAFTCLGVVATASLFLVGKGDWHSAAWAYGIATLGFSASLVFYDAMLVDVATPARANRVSALGFALGYLGGGVLFALNVAMTLWPNRFGFPDVASAVRASFLMVAVWWFLFTLPLLLRVKTPPQAARPATEILSSAAKQLRHTLHKLRSMPQVWHFLLAYWLYIDGVDTLIRMAVDFGLSIGFTSKDLIAALLLTQFVGFPAAIAYGRLGDRIGTKRAILIAIGVYVLITLWAFRMQDKWEFYVLACAVGLVQGGVQALSRSLYSKLIPADEAAEFFGFYNMLGKSAAVLGPLLMAMITWLTGSTRLSILSISALFLAGGYLLSKVELTD